MANTQRVLSLSRNYAYKPYNPITSLQVNGLPEELRLCRVMKNALLRRKTRRPYKQPPTATTWQPTWLFSVAVLVALYACQLCLILICQEFTTHQHLLSRVGSRESGVGSDCVREYK